MKSFVNIDLQNLELLESRLENLSSAPSSADGRVYFNTLRKEVGYYDGTQWLYFAISGSTVNIDVSGLVTTGSFNSYTASIDSFIQTINNYTASTTRDSASFNSRINALNSVTNSYTLLTEFRPYSQSINLYTASVTRDSASFDLRINSFSGSGAIPTLNSVLLAGSASNASASFGGLFVNNLNIYKTVKNLLSGSDNLMMVAGVIRPTVNAEGYVSWSWIDNTDHTKLGFKNEVKVNGNGSIQIYYNFTCSKVISMLAVTDEGGSNTGVTLGSSVGTADALIYFGFPKTNGSTIYWGGSSYTFQGAGWYGGGSSITYSTSSGNIDVNISSAGNNPNWEPYSVTATSISDSYRVIYDVFNSNATRLRFRMIKQDGSILSASNMGSLTSGFTYQGSGYQTQLPVDFWGGNNNWIPTFLGVPSANYWIIGIFQL